MYYLCSLAHFQERTDGVEGSCATDVQVSLVVWLEDPDEVRALFLEKKWDKEHQNPHLLSNFIQWDIQLAKRFEYILCMKYRNLFM